MIYTVYHDQSKKQEGKKHRRECRRCIIYLRTKRTPRVPGPQWQETVQPASV